MKRIPLVDNLKLRIGYGLAGNQSGIDSYTTLNLVKPNGVVPVGSSQVVTLGNMRNTNPDLKWEVKRTFNAGVDLGMFGNRLLFSLNYYNSKPLICSICTTSVYRLSPITLFGQYWFHA